MPLINAARTAATATIASPVGNATRWSTTMNSGQRPGQWPNSCSEHGPATRLVSQSHNTESGLYEPRVFAAGISTVSL